MQTRSLLLLLMAMSGIGPISLNIIVPALPGLVTRLDTDTETIQLMISLYLLGLAVSQLLMGPLSDRFGRRPVVIAGLALTAVASFAAIAASTAGSLIIARLIQSLGASTGLVVGRAIIRDLFDRDRAASMIGLVTTVMVIAPMLGPFIGGLLDTAFGWEATFLFVAVASSIVVVSAAIALPETRVQAASPQERPKYFSELGKLARNPAFAGYVVAAALGSGPFFTLLGGGPHVVVTMMGRTSAEYGAWFAVTALGFMLGNFSAARLSVRYGVIAMIWWGIGIMVLGTLIGVVCLLLLPGGGPAVIFLPQVISSVGNGMLLPNAIAGAVSVRPQAAGAASGITGFSQMAIGAASAQAIGHVLAGAATPMPMVLIMLGFALATAVAFWLLVRRNDV